MSRLTESPAWKALQDHHDAIAGTPMRELFAADPERFAKFSVRFKDILLDYSKNCITDETMRLLLALAEQAGLPVYQPASLKDFAVGLIMELVAMVQAGKVQV